MRPREPGDHDGAAEDATRDGASPAQEGEPAGGTSACEDAETGQPVFCQLTNRTGRRAKTASRGGGSLIDQDLRTTANCGKKGVEVEKREREMKSRSKWGARPRTGCFLHPGELGRTGVWGDTCSACWRVEVGEPDQARQGRRSAVGPYALSGTVATTGSFGKLAKRH